MISDYLGLLREKYYEDWKPVGRVALIAWLVFYALFLFYMARAGGGMTLFDNVNLVVHEAGHALFGWFGMTIGIMGGTILQLLVPFLLCASFFWQRHTGGAAFCAFVFFENFLGISVYMADARAMALPLVTVGDPDNVEHDWHYIFGHFGLLQHDTQIAAVVRVLGWLGMLATIGWLAWRATRPAPRALPASAR
jgi:hypothetical protein